MAVSVARRIDGAKPGIRVHASASNDDAMSKTEANGSYKLVRAHTHAVKKCAIAMKQIACHFKRCEL